MSKPVIGITTYGKNDDNRFTLPVFYGNCVQRAGGVSLFIPPYEEEPREYLDGMDGIILAGGGDLDPKLYGGEPHEMIYMVDEVRDRSELLLSRAVVERNIPVLAICRGIQVLNVALGGTLHPHLPDVVGESVLHRLPPRKPTPHGLRILPGSLLQNILGITETVAHSWHHQAIRDVAENLVAVAWSEDELIEAVELPNHPWCLGVQWHPELTAHEDPLQQRLFDALVDAARKKEHSP